MNDIFDEIAPDVQTASPDIFDQVEPEAPVNLRFKNFLADDIPSNDWRETRKAELAATQKLIAEQETPLLSKLAARGAAGLEKGMTMPERAVRGALDLVNYYPALDAVLGTGDKYQKYNADWLKYFHDRDQQLDRETRALGDAGFAGDVVEGAARGVVELPTQLMGGAAGAARQAAIKGAAITAGFTSGLGQYAQDRGEGRGKTESAIYSGTSGLITGLTTAAFGATGVESIFKNEGVRGVGRRILEVLKQTGLEGAEESVDQFQQDLLERVARNPDKPIGQSVHDILLAGTVGALIGGGVSTVRQLADVAINPREDALPAIAREIEPAGTPQFFRQPEADSLRAEASGASDRVTAAIADRWPITGQDARLAGARDRLPELGYAYSEKDDVFTPVRKVETTAGRILTRALHESEAEFEKRRQHYAATGEVLPPPEKLPDVPAIPQVNAQPSKDPVAAVPIKETAPLPPVKPKPNIGNVFANFGNAGTVAFREKMLKDVAEGKDVTFTKPLAIKLAREDTTLELRDNADGSVTVIGLKLATPAPLPPVKTPELLPGERLVTVERPDGTTYLAAFGDKFYDVPKMGGKRASIARVVDDSWSHGALGIGEKIIEFEAKPAETPKAPPDKPAIQGMPPSPPEVLNEGDVFDGAPTVLTDEGKLISGVDHADAKNRAEEQGYNVSKPLGQVSGWYKNGKNYLAKDYEGKQPAISTPVIPAPSLPTPAATVKKPTARQRVTQQGGKAATVIPPVSESAPKVLTPGNVETTADVQGAQASKPLGTGSEFSPKVAREQKKFLLDAVDQAIAEAPEERAQTPADADLGSLESVRHYKPGETSDDFHAREEAVLDVLATKYNIPWEYTAYEAPMSLELGQRVMSSFPAGRHGPGSMIPLLETPIRKAILEANKVTIEVPGDGTFDIINTKYALEDFKERAAKFPTTAAKPKGPSSARTSATPAAQLGKPDGASVLAALNPVVSTDEGRKIIHNIWSDGKQSVATNGRMLTLVRVGLGGTAAKPIVVNTDGKLVKLEKDEKFPDWTQVFPAETKESMPNLDTEKLFTVLRQAQEATSEKSNSVKLWRNKDGSLGVTANAPEVASYSHNVHNPDVSQVIMAIDPKYLINAINAARRVGDQTVTLKWTDELAPLVIESKTSKSVIMPIRLSTGIEGAPNEPGRDDGRTTQGGSQEDQPRVGQIPAEQGVSPGDQGSAMAQAARVEQDLQGSGEVLWGSRAEIAEAFSDSGRPAPASGKSTESTSGRRTEDLRRGVDTGSAQGTPGVFENTRIFIERPSERAPVSTVRQAGILAHRILFGGVDAAQAGHSGLGFIRQLYGKLPGLKIVIYDFGKTDDGKTIRTLAQYQRELSGRYDVVQINSRMLEAYDLSNPNEVQAVYAAVIEELLHSATYRSSTPEELLAVWKSLSPEEQAATLEAYEGEIPTEEYRGAEYVRMILQERLTGEASEAYKPKWRITEAARKALQNLVDWLKQKFGAKSADNIARQIIERIESAIKGDAPIAGSVFGNTGPPLRSGIETAGDDTKQQRTFGADIGEDQNIENVKAIQAALVENGYGIGDTVTPENTSQAWEQFASFVDPAKRADTLAALHAAVPQEMAPGIVHSTLWQYAVRLAATGDPALFRAMTANSNQFVLWDGPTFRSTLGRGLRALGLGADFTTWKNELERTKAQRAAIAKELGLNPKDISLIDMLITNLNGAVPDADAVVDAVGNGKLPDGGTVTDVLKKKPAGGSRKPKIDDEAGDELEDAANRTAAEILRRLQLDYAGVEWLKPGSRPLGIIQQILRDHYKGREPILPILGNSNRVIDALAGRFTDEAGVEADLAQQLANAAEVKRQSDWTNARNRAIQRAKNSGSLRGLIDEILATPYLAQANPDWVRETAINWFLANGLSREQAEGATALFQTEFNAKLLEAQIKVAERLLAKAPPKNLRDFIEALRAGLLDPDKPWLDAYAKKAGWNVPTRAQFQRLAELELKLQDPNLSASEQAETTEAMTGIYLHLKLPPALMQRIAANFVVTALTGIRTMTVNLFAPLERLVTETALRTVTRPQDFVRNIQTLFNAYGKNWAAARRMKFSLHKDAYTFLNNEFTQATNEQRRLWEEAEADFASGDNVRQTKAMVKGLYGSQQFAMRLLNAADQANAMAEREVQLLNYGSAAFREAGLGTQAVTALVQAASRLKQAAYETAIQQGRSPDQAQVDADEVAIEQLEDFVAKELANTGDPDAKTKARQMVEAATKDAYSAIGRLAPGIEETDEGGIVSRAVYHNILKASNFLRGGKGADPILGVSLLGYVSIPFRTGRHMLWNGPYGLLRLGIHHFRKGRVADNQWKQTLANEYQERQRLKLALAGTAAWAMIGALGFALLGKSGDDDAGEEDDFGFYVTGRGPKSKNLRDAWLKSGFRENSLVAFIFGKPIAIPMTRVGEPLAHLFWLLSARDDHGWRKREAEAAGKEFKETWSTTTGRAAGTYLGMVGQRGLLQNITQWARLGSGEGGSDKVLADLASKTVAGAVLPWLGMQRSLIGMTEGQLDRSSIESAMAANFGIPGVYWNKQAVNRFGDPLGNRTWFGRIGDTGVPLAFQVAETNENQQFYRTLAQKGAAPPELRRYVAEEKYGPLTDDQFSDFARRSGAMLKRSVSQNLAGLERMTPDQVKDYMGKVAGQSDRTAAMALGLTAVKPATRTTAAVEPEAVPLLPAPRRLSSGRVRAAVGRSRGIGRARSRIGRTRLATMRVPRLRAGRTRAYLTRSRSFRRPRRVRSAMSRIRRPRLSYA